MTSEAGKVRKWMLYVEEYVFPTLLRCAGRAKQSISLWPSERDRVGVRRAFGAKGVRRIALGVRIMTSQEWKDVRVGVNNFGYGLTRP